jgi:flagellar protein FlgJ
MTTPVPDASVYSDLSGLAALKRDARAQDPNALRQVAKQFESVFAKMMLTSMRQASSSFGDPIFGSDQTKFVQGMFDDQLSIEMTKGRGLGLADMLVRQLQKTPGFAKPADAAGGVSKGSDAAGTGVKLPTSGSGPTSAPDSTQRPAAFLPLRGGKNIPSLDTPGTAAPGEPEAAEKAAALHVASQLLANWHSGSAGEATTFPFAADSAELSDDLDATASLRLASAFINRMLAGNAAANGDGPQFKTPSSPEEFVQQLWPCAEEAGRELGIDPRNLLAQAALETGWGKSLPCDANGNPSYNFFGIKAGGNWQGGSVSVKTLEFEGGLPTPRQAKFRAYESAAHSFRDYVSVLRDNPRYAAALNTGKDAKAFATALQKGGYATDPAYAQKIASIAQNLAATTYSLKSADSQPTPSPPGAL